MAIFDMGRGLGNLPEFEPIRSATEVAATQKAEAMRRQQAFTEETELIQLRKEVKELREWKARQRATEAARMEVMTRLMRTPHDERDFLLKEFMKRFDELLDHMLRIKTKPVTKESSSTAYVLEFAVRVPYKEFLASRAVQDPDFWWGTAMKICRSLAEEARELLYGGEQHSAFGRVPQPREDWEETLQTYLDKAKQKAFEAFESKQKLSVTP